MLAVPSSIEVKDTSMSDFKFYLMGFIVLILFLHVIFPFLYLFVFPDVKPDLLSDLLFVLGFVGFVDILLIPAITILIKNKLPILRVKFHISKESFSVLIQDSLYFHIPWSEIKKIKVIKVRFIGFKINFINSAYTHTLRLFLLIFKKKKRVLLLDYLNKFATELNIPLENSVEKDDDTKELEDDYYKIKKFKKETKKV